MKNTIELTIEHKDHSTVELTNSEGDTFTYNPQKYEGLEDFLSGAKNLGVGDIIHQSELLNLLTEIANSDTLYINTRHRLIAKKTT